MRELSYSTLSSEVILLPNVGPVLTVLPISLISGQLNMPACFINGSDNRIQFILENKILGLLRGKQGVQNLTECAMSGHRIFVL